MSLLADTSIAGAVLWMGDPTLDSKAVTCLKEWTGKEAVGWEGV